MSKSLRKNFIAYTILNFFNLAFPFLITPIVFHRLGVSGIGIVLFVQNIVAYFVLFANMAIPNYGIRQVARVRDNQVQLQRTFSELFSLQICQNIIFWLIYLYVITYLSVRSNIHTSNLIYYLFSLNILFGALSLNWVFEGLEDFKFVTLRTIVLKLFSGIAIILLVHSDADVGIYALCLFIPDFILGIFSVIYLYRKVGFSLKNPLPIIKQSWRVLLNVFMLYSAYFLMTNLDILLLGYNSDSTQIAYYGISSKIIGILFTMLLSFIYVAGPRLSNYANTDRVAFNNLLERLSGFLLLPVFTFVLLVLLAGKDILYFFGGLKFVAANPILQVFAIYFLIMALRYFISSYVYFTNGKERFVALSFYFSLCCSIIIKIIFREHLGGLGLISITTCSELIILLILAINMARVTNTLFSFWNINNLKFLIAALMVFIGFRIYLLGAGDFSLFSTVKLGIMIVISFWGVIFILREENIISVYAWLKVKVKGIN